jgi:diguanylate cyclase (GGDEF)-like protein
VIGAVLANHVELLSRDEERAIREAVAQSAPVLGNLRNLAIAEQRSATDALTGLPNRRAIDDTLKRMVAQSARTLTPLAALMCDLDHFKHINDQFGHGSGDDVLAAVGAALAGTKRASDFVGRYGGEEFILLLPGTGVTGACEIAERIRRAVAAIEVPAVTQRVTLSVGVAVLPDHAVDAGSLERAADRALYAAKGAGRDRIEVFGIDAPDADGLVEANRTRGQNGGRPEQKDVVHALPVNGLMET